MFRCLLLLLLAAAALIGWQSAGPYTWGVLLVGITATYALSVAAGGVSIQQSIARSSDAAIALQTSISAGKTVTAWVKTDADTAACNLPGGHGYTNGKFDVYWSGGRRYDVDGTISTNALSLDGGTGDDFPASATTGVICCKATQGNVLIDGDNVKLIALCAEPADPADVSSRAHILFEDSNGDNIAAIDLAANTPKVYDITGGATNPFTGDVIVSCSMSAEIAMTIKIAGVQDATP